MIFGLTINNFPQITKNHNSSGSSFDSERINMHTAYSWVLLGFKIIFNLFLNILQIDNLIHSIFFNKIHLMYQIILNSFIDIKNINWIRFILLIPVDQHLKTNIQSIVKIQLIFEARIIPPFKQTSHCNFKNHLRGPCKMAWVFFPTALYMKPCCNSSSRNVQNKYVFKSYIHAIVDMSLC